MDWSREQVIEKVREYLARTSFDRGLLVQVLEAEAHGDEEEWFVPVRTEKPPDGSSGYYEMLAEIESLLFKNEGISVTLLPTLPKKS